MRVAKFCERNIEKTASANAASIIQRDYSSMVEVRIVDCFRRCLQCSIKPFCRIQLNTIEADDADSLVEAILQAVSET